MRVAVPGVCTKSLLLLVMLIVARAAGQLEEVYSTWEASCMFYNRTC